jgi:hypothetical protein
VQERPRFLTRFDAGDGGMSEAVIVQNQGWSSCACGWRMMRPTTGPLVDHDERLISRNVANR